MCIIVVMVLTTHVLNKSLDAIHLTDITLNELPDFEQRLILIRTGYCNEPVDVGHVDGLVFRARSQ